MILNIPERCTGYVQQLDTILRKLLKEERAAQTGEGYDDSVGGRRIGSGYIQIRHLGKQGYWINHQLLQYSGLLSCMQLAVHSLANSLEVALDYLVCKAYALCRGGAMIKST